MLVSYSLIVRVAVPKGGQGAERGSGLISRKPGLTPFSVPEVFRDAAAALGYAIGQLPPEEADELYQDLAVRYSPDPRFLNLEWVRDSEVVHDARAVYRLSEFLGQREVLALFGRSDGGEVLMIPRGDMVVPVVREMPTPSFVFAVTTRSREFLLSRDDHECLIGAGAAAAWVSQLRTIKEAQDSEVDH